MKSFHPLRAVLVSAIFSVVISTPLKAETSIVDHHSHDGHATSGLSLDQGKKWKTDAPLREGMQSINDAVMNAVPEFHHNKLKKSDAEKLAKHINGQVAYLVTNCKLEPMADATLHVLIGELVTASHMLSKDPLSSQGLPVMVKVLQQYPVYFDHQGWNKDH